MSREKNELSDVVNGKAIDELLVNMAQQQRKTNAELVKIIKCVIIGYTMIVISMVVGFFWYESQFEVVTTTSTTTTTEIDQEVSGENSEINNVSGNYYKDNATHNGN